MHLSKVEQAVRDRAAEVYERNVREFAATYDRRDLARRMHVHVANPFDYGTTNTEVIIAKLELKLENFRAAPSHWTVNINPALLMAQLEAALFVERNNLRQARAA